MHRRLKLKHYNKFWRVPGQGVLNKKTRGVNLAKVSLLELSECPFSSKHYQHTPRKYLNIFPEIPIVDIVQVIAEFLVHITVTGIILSFNLSQSGHPRFKCKPFRIVLYLRSKLAHKIEPFRAWANQRHISFKNIPELREFIQSGSS